MKARGQLHSPSALPLGLRDPGTHYIEGWVTPEVVWEGLQKEKTLMCLLGIKLRIVKSTSY